MSSALYFHLTTSGKASTQGLNIDHKNNFWKNNKSLSIRNVLRINWNVDTSLETTESSAINIRGSLTIWPLAMWSLLKTKALLVNPLESGQRSSRIYDAENQVNTTLCMSTEVIKIWWAPSGSGVQEEDWGHCATVQQGMWVDSNTTEKVTGTWANTSSWHQSL